MTARLSIRVAPPTTTFNILNYGAICGTNPAVTCNAAINEALVLASAVGGTVVVPACGGGGRFYLDSTLPGGALLQDNVTLQLDGILQSITMTTIEYAVVAAWDKSNITITGSGQIIGDLATHDPLGDGQYGHCLQLEHVANVSISGITLSQGWGDGIYVNNNFGTGQSTNVTCTGVTSNHNRRNNLSVVDCNGGSFINGALTNALPDILGAGFDFEPNVMSETVTGWTVTGNLISGNAGYAGQLVCLFGTVTGNITGPNNMIGNGHNSVLNTGGCS